MEQLESDMGKLDPHLIETHSFLLVLETVLKPSIVLGVGMGEQRFFSLSNIHGW